MGANRSLLSVVVVVGLLAATDGSAAAADRDIAWVLSQAPADAAIVAAVRSLQEMEASLRALAGPEANIPPLVGQIEKQLPGGAMDTAGQAALIVFAEEGGPAVAEVYRLGDDSRLGGEEVEKGILKIVPPVPAAPPGADEKVTIKVRYTPGTYVMTVNTDAQSEITALGGEPENQDMKNQIVMEMTAEKPQHDGHQKITVIYKRATFSMTGGGMSESYDSAQPEDKSNPMGAVYGHMIGVPIEVLLDEDGNVIKATRMEKIGEATAKEPLAAAKDTEQMIKAMFGFLKQFTPKVPVGKGDRWTTTIKQGVPIISEMDIKTNCRLEEIRQTKAGKLAVIAFDGKASKAKAKTPDGPPHGDRLV